MKIYQFLPDYEQFKFFTLTDENNSSKRARTFCGQPLAHDWIPLKATVFHGKTKAEKSRRLDFSISCYDGRVLLVDDEIGKWFKKAVKDGVEILPVETDAGSFSFVNVLGSITAINFEGLSDEEKMAMLRDKRLQFRKDVIGERAIFRDSAIKEVFVTQDFVEKMRLVPTHGAILSEVGMAF